MKQNKASTYIHAKDPAFAAEIDHYIDTIGLESIAKCIPYDSDTLYSLYKSNNGFDMSTPVSTWEQAAGWEELTPYPYKRMFKNTSYLFQKLLSEHELSHLTVDTCIAILKRSAERIVQDGQLVPIKVKALFFAPDGHCTCEDDIFVSGDKTSPDSIIDWIKENYQDNAGMSIVCMLGQYGDGRPWLIPTNQRLDIDTQEETIMSPNKRFTLIRRGGFHQVLLGVVRVIDDLTYEETTFLQRISEASEKLSPRWEDGDILEPMTNAPSDLISKQEILDIMYRDEGPGNTKRVIDKIREFIGMDINTQKGD